MSSPVISEEKSRRLTNVQVHTLQVIAEGTIYSASIRTLRSLANRGYVTGIPSMCQITEAGRKALESYL
jgi:hypothetical protein